MSDGCHYFRFVSERATSENDRERRKRGTGGLFKREGEDAFQTKKESKRRTCANPNPRMGVGDLRDSGSLTPI